MADAGCINAYDVNWCFLQTIDTLNSEDVWQDVCYRFPNIWNREVDYVCYIDKCGCSCRVDWENEFIIHSTQWVLNAITLTQNSSNSTVNVKWSELFWGNWKKTVVRYKTGGYPVSEVDWTLAVEETTQNQYATNWYTISGLADATTYYFRAFAVAQDDTIIIVQSSVITTDFFRWKYQKVEYIQSSWTQRISTWIAVASWVRANIDFQITSTSVADQAVIWYYNNETTVSYRCWYGQNNGFTLSWWVSVTTRQTWTWSSISENASSYILQLFCKQRYSDNRYDSYAYARLYSCQIYNSSNTKVRDFIPVYRKSDNVIWLVDSVNKVFYTNAGTWTFTKGPNV